MKKGTIRYNRVHCRKWIVTWAVLILILSLISLSAAGSGNNTYSQENAGSSPDLEIIPDQDVHCGENTGESLETKTDAMRDAASQESANENPGEIIEATSDTDREGSHDENVETGTEPGERVYNQESVVKNLDTGTGLEKDSGSHESIEERTETKTKTKQDTDNQEDVERNSNLKEVESYSIDNQEDPESNLKTIEEAESETNNPETVGESSATMVKEEKDTGNPERIEKNTDTQTGIKDATNSQKNTQGNPETIITVEKSTDNQENHDRNLEAGEVESCSVDSLKSPDKNPAWKKEAKENPESLKNTEANLRLKVSLDNEKRGSENSETKNEMKTRLCEGSKSLKIVETETELQKKGCSGIKSFKICGLNPETKIKACNSEENLESGNSGFQINIRGINWTYVQGTDELKPEIKPGASSWNNLKFILSYPCSLRSFYTTHESVKINYKGSEALRGQKINVYLVKAHDAGFSTETVKNVTDSSTISSEDILSRDTEFYIQIPATLNEGGDLSPLTLGPFPEGSYLVLITLAENEKRTLEPQETVLLANYFEVFKYEMEAQVPSTLKAGENFEVNMNLKNSPAQENCTYWALLTKEETCQTNTNIGSDTSSTKAVNKTFVQGLRLIRDLGSDPASYNSQTGKDEFKNEIRAFMGEGNGTISIGEENQNILSLKILGLAPGKYLFFAGAYEKDRGLAGMVQKELTILPINKEDSYSKPYSGNDNSSNTLSKEQSFLPSGN